MYSKKAVGEILFPNKNNPNLISPTNFEDDYTLVHSKIQQFYYFKLLFYLYSVRNKSIHVRFVHCLPLS